MLRYTYRIVTDMKQFEIDSSRKTSRPTVNCVRFLLTKFNWAIDPRFGLNETVFHFALEKIESGIKCQ